MVWRSLILMMVLCASVEQVRAQAPERAVLHGETTTQRGAVALPGVTISVQREDDNREVSLLVSDAQGRFRVVLPPGTYRLRAALSGFAPMVRTGLILEPRADVRVDLDIPLAVSSAVTVAGDGDDVPGATVLSRVDGRLFDVAPVRGDDFQALLPTLPGVMRGPDGRINLKGGRPSQTGLQMGAAYVRDPSTGDAGVALPVDAVATIEVLPNPYAAEFGRFSSGVAQVDTRRGGDTWKTTINNFIPVPCLKLCDGGNWGIRNYDPRILVQGPLVLGRLFLAQSVQFHDKKERVTSLPRGEADTTIRGLESFTRLDLRSGSHVTTATMAAFPQNASFVGLDTFHPREVSPDVRRRGYALAVSDTWQLGSRAWLESTVSRTRYRNEVDRRGVEPMVLTPEGARGTFFQDVSREADSTQASGVVGLTLRHAGDHLVRAGVDVLRSSFTGTSRSGDVEIRDDAGDLLERWSFTEFARQAVRATDVALFAQDRWRITDRVILEGGARVDRDGVTQRWIASPRTGFVVGVLPDGVGVVRGGIGRFADRTPLLAGAFGDIESPTVTRGLDDLPLSQVAYRHVADTLEPARARVWNLEYDHRLAPGWMLKVNRLVRDGGGELTVNPSAMNGDAIIQLGSRGRSRYRETEVTLHHAGRGERQVTVTYVRSRSEADLNAFDNYAGVLRQPIVRANEFGPTSVNVPHRLVALAVLPVKQWLVSPLVEVRDGFPYSLVDASQQFVGPRNGGGRYPRFASLDLTILKTVTVAGRRARVGFRSNHLLNNFTPRDIQNNLASPNFGRLFNPIVRRIGLTFELQP